MAPNAGPVGADFILTAAMWHTNGVHCWSCDSQQARAACRRRTTETDARSFGTVNHFSYGTRLRQTQPGGACLLQTASEPLVFFDGEAVGHSGQIVGHSAVESIALGEPGEF
jgi:hypothetical protein